ncbi:HAD family hydrolase [Pseudanabaena sp. FACHB-2040]|uniref:HAD family hydrolase n=1 Tax=Pseudanabaena sp. FACHB-2040 TaxID=2692859 RepID=UPI00168266FA|nr:HAD family hydrolase [Pseudanabaena sp. FACHB-2040]MBD2259954.1 HAD family hydrolase [Pseudanabaena sp. FACHB-2040]
MAVIQCEGTAFPQIAAVVFDKDGTLADSQDFLRTLAQKRARLLDAQIPGVQEPLLMAFGVDGGTLDSQGLMAVGTRHENEIAAAAYVAETGRSWTTSVELVRAAFTEADSYLKQKAQLTPPYTGTETVLAALSAAGVKIGVLSSDSTANVEAFLSCHHLENYVDLTQGTDQADLVKPNPELLLRMCAGLEVSPANVLVVGDSEMDLKLARNAGAAGFVLMDWAGAAPFTQEADATLQAWSSFKVEA